MTPRELAELFWSPLHDWGLGEDEMTEAEARKVVDIMRTADGGCRYCVGALLRQFKEAFPQFEVEEEEETLTLIALAEDRAYALRQKVRLSAANMHLDRLKELRND